MKKRKLQKRRKKYIRRRIFLLIVLIGFLFAIYQITPKIVNFFTEKEISISKEKSNRDYLEEDYNLVIDSLNNYHSIAFLENYYENIDINKKTDSYEVLFEKSTEEDFISILEQVLEDQKDPNTFLLDSKSLEEFSSLDTDLKKFKRYFEDEKVKESARNISPKEREVSNLELNTPIPGRTASIKINRFDESNRKSDGEKIKNFVRQLSDYDLLIIDIREADGYSIDYFLENLVQPFLREELSMTGEYLFKNEIFEEFLSTSSKYLTLYPSEPLKNNDMNIDLSKEILTFFKYYRQFEISIKPEAPNQFYGKIYLLQDHETKNAADLFSQFCNQTGFAVTCGEYTKGYGMNILPSFLKLPNTNYIISFSTRLGLNPDGSINPDIGTKPEIKLENQDTFQQLMDIIH